MLVRVYGLAEYGSDAKPASPVSVAGEPSFDAPHLITGGPT
jgi:hypothetical protein